MTNFIGNKNSGVTVLKRIKIVDVVEPVNELFHSQQIERGRRNKKYG
jgi:hypothetical protein